MVIKKPNECSGEELEKIKNVILEGSQVANEGLERRILNCKLIGLYYVRNDLVGVSAIKQPAINYIERILRKAKIKGESIPQFELGYSVTLEKYRGRGINKEINDSLLESFSSKNIFATTDNETMKTYLENKGFKKKGISFKGFYNENLVYYEIC